MSTEAPVFLVAPYDRYPSIDRFVACLERELSSKFSVRILRPRPILSRFGGPAVRKWMAYADKFLLFPRLLARESAGAGLVHLCDQSTAIYTHGLRHRPHLLTCNDLIAIRAALGELPEHRPGLLGRKLQRAILQGVKSARVTVCISEATRNDLVRLTGVPRSNVRVIPMGLHFPYQRLTPETALRTVRRFTSSASFLLHVGGNQWPKNRAGVLAIYNNLLARNPKAPDLVLLGEELTVQMKRFLQEHNLGNRVFLIPNASDDDLRAFYSVAAALIFPSFYEGFGWPIIEAQACGCPVATSDRPAMTEVGGSAAIYVAPEDPSAAAAKLAELLAESSQLAADRRQRGFENSARFSTARMVSAYAELYPRLMSAPAGANLTQPAFV